MMSIKMEYKPPLDPNSRKRYRFIYCGLDSNDVWQCVRCEKKEQCDLALPSFQSQMSRLIEVNDDLPRIFDTWTVKRCLQVSNIELK